MIKELIKLATHLDSTGHRKEADYLDSVITKMAQQGQIAEETVSFGGTTTTSTPSSTITSQVSVVGSIDSVIADTIEHLRANNWVDVPGMSRRTMAYLLRALDRKGVSSANEIQSLLQANANIDQNVAATKARDIFNALQESRRGAAPSNQRQQRGETAPRRQS